MHENYNDFESISIKLASPERIKEWSFGEVIKADTINYRTLKAEKSGLFCERIFGTKKDWECSCGKFKSIRYKGVICDKCGVEVSHSKVRRERGGHVELACPVAHIWYYRSIPSRIALLLNITNINLRSVLYFEKYIVTEPGDSDLSVCDVIEEEDYGRYIELYEDKFMAAMGAEAIKELLSKIDIDTEIRNIRQKIQESTKALDSKTLKRLQILESFADSTNRLEWMILENLPVIPAELRPMVQLEGGKFATSDLNDLYRRVINRNNRLKRLQHLKAPEIIVKNEKRMLQESIDSLFDNSRKTKVMKSKGNRPLKSLADMLKGKQGRFRQNLLGKRVDYSGRSVIVVGPELKYYQMGLPKEMALELYKPFIIRRLLELDLVINIKLAKKKIEHKEKEVFDVLEDVVKDHPVLLNRAPTLHRLGIQGFSPVIIEGKAIKLHPLVCHAFNADFDGDQMAVHVALTPKSQLEVWTLMLSAHNLLNPANGHPICGPTQDIILGLYYLTSELPTKDKKIKYFSSLEESIYAYENKKIKIREIIGYSHQDKIIQTTLGRMILNDLFPADFGYINRVLNDKEINQIIVEIYEKYGISTTVVFVDKLKELGYKYATLFAPTISVDDIKISSQKQNLIEKANQEVKKADKEYRSGIITDEERYKKVIEIWTKTNDLITENMFNELKKDKNGFNPVYVMASSGARGSKQQIRQLCGMRGLMAKPSGEIIELAIQSNFKEGLNVLEFFISTHGARKGLSDTALKTADAGYLTRKLVDISQDVVINSIDCQTKKGIILHIVRESGNVIVSLFDRIFGRYTSEEIIDPVTEKVIYPKSTLITREIGKKIETLGYEKLKVRSPLTCESDYGLCMKCYGMDMAKLVPVEIGEAVGIIAAQSIGQPGTQLTMRTFHIGGAASAKIQEREHKFPYPVLVQEISGKIVNHLNQKVFSHRGFIIVQRLIQKFPLKKLKNIKVQNKEKVGKGQLISFSSDTNENIIADKPGLVHIKKNTLYILGDEINIPIKVGAILNVSVEDICKPNQPLSEFDPYNDVIISNLNGSIFWEDLEIGVNIRKEEDFKTSTVILQVVEQKRKKFNPKIIINGLNGEQQEYEIPIDAILSVEDGQKVVEGDTIFKVPTIKEKTRDITGGLPRVTELFEARRPANASILAEIDGKIEDRGEISRDKRIIYIVPDDSFQKDKVEIKIPVGKQLRVRPGDYVKKGEQIDEGTFDPHDILKIKGITHLQDYLIKEVQEVYRLQGVHINDKHIEVVVRQMLRNVLITDSGDTVFVNQQQVDKKIFLEENKKVEEEGGNPATATSVMLGLTKSALNTESFLSAASFQETTKILTDAAIKGKIDPLIGLKENVIIGNIIPAGTGLKTYRQIEVFKEKYGDLDKGPEPLEIKDEKG